MTISLVFDNRSDGIGPHVSERWSIAAQGPPKVVQKSGTMVKNINVF